VWLKLVKKHTARRETPELQRIITPPTSIGVIHDPCNCECALLRD
jgi:hypothetical protein